MRFVDAMALPMQAGALLAEGVVILYFASRRLTMGIFIFCAVLHTMIFVTTGILFWKWMLVNLGLFGAFWVFGRTDFRLAFPRWTLLLSTGTKVIEEE